MAQRKKHAPPNAREDPSPTSRGDAQPLILAAVVACFVLSGFAALLYQTAWLRQFSLVFGTSELAVATVLAAYMGGLALGAAIAGRYAARVKRPVLVYGLLEAGIAVSALCVPVLLMMARTLYAAALGGQAAPPDAAAIGQPIFYLVVAFVVLALPTSFMGATLPLLTRYAVRADRDVGPRVALLYATNTGGAVCGTVVAAFVLLPVLGLNATVWVGVAVNAVVFFIAAALARRAPERAADSVPDAPPTGFVDACVRPLFARGATPARRLGVVLGSQPAWILPLMLMSGAVAFVYEVLWTRMLAHVMGGSIYAFATMLAAFLTGIALGGGLAGSVADNKERATAAFTIAQVAIAVLSAGIYTWMVPLVPTDLTNHWLAAYAVVVMLPATIFIGATLPLAVRILARDETQAAVAAARIYAWNTVGAIIGAVLAGFILIPALGFEGTIRFAVVTNLGLALWAAAVIIRPRPLPVGVTAMLCLVTFVGYNPTRPEAVVSSTGFILQYLDDPREVYYGVGRTSTVMMVAQDGYYYLRTNGLPEASISARGSPPVQDPEKWLTALAVAARPDTRDMLVIGFGGGVALEGVPPSIDRIDVVELEPEVIAANRRLQGARNSDPLEDPRFNVIINDARNALHLTDKTYDAIVSQPSHPWTAGASHLFTREFVADAKRHLHDGGVFVQWMNSEFVEERLLRTLAATLLAEFANVRLYHPSAQVLVFLASDAALDIEAEIARTGQPFTADVMHYSRLGMNGPEDLFAALAMDEAGVEAFARGAPLSTDNNNLMATDSSSRADGLLLGELSELFEPHDPLLQPDSWVHTRFGNTIDYGYIARRILYLGQPVRAERFAQAAPSAAQRAEIAGLVHRASGQTARAAQAFRSAIMADPDNLQARYFLVRDQLGAAGRGEAPEAIQTAADGLTGPARAVMEGWGFGLAGDWAALAELDAELGRSRITDAWYPDAARLRAEWRTNVAVEPERYAFDALRMVERALLLAPDQNLYLLRVVSSVEIGDDDRVLESSRYIMALIGQRLAQAQAAGFRLSIQELARLRQNLAAIAERLRSGLQVGDPPRVRRVLADVNELIEVIDGYPSTPAN